MAWTKSAHIDEVVLFLPNHNAGAGMEFEVPFVDTFRIHPGDGGLHWVTSLEMQTPETPWWEG